MSTDLSPLSRGGGGFSSDDASQQQTPDSGAVSDIYSIPHSSHHHRHDVTSDTVNDDDTRTYVNAADDDELAHMERDIKLTSWLMANNTDTVKRKHLTDTAKETSSAANEAVTNVNTSIDAGGETLSVPCTEAAHINVLNSGLPSCPNCQCTLAYYELLDQHQSLERRALRNGEHTSTSSDDYKRQVSLHSIKQTLLLRGRSSSAAVAAMQLYLDTLNRDCPGCLCIITVDSSGGAHDFSPWSPHQRYKVASSRNPQRWLAEFRARRIDVDIIWQVKVKQHLKACREVHEHLDQYHVLSNWFECSLSTIMEAMSTVVRKYRP